jgi:hypothetical protein
MKFVNRHARKITAARELFKRHRREGKPSAVELQIFIGRRSAARLRVHSAALPGSGFAGFAAASFRGFLD